MSKCFQTMQLNADEITLQRPWPREPQRLQCYLCIETSESKEWANPPPRLILPSSVRPALACGFV